MKIEIKSTYGSVLFEGDFSSIAEAVKAAIAQHANLSYADLRYADLRYANLSYADLSSANLSSANLSYADLRYADLRYADLRSADLRYADLRYANLSSADLRYADLRYADLSSANLSSANLSYADLRSANLSSAKNSELAVAQTRILPDGALIGWKKLSGGCVARLRIPEAAKRSHAFGRKCRAEYAEVLEMFGSVEAWSTTSSGPRTRYAAGETVHCDQWNDDFTQECTGGIHFFITRAEAEAYVP